jgi:sugar transferase (PEP-CTERM/EpsH1 system associated)
MKILLVAPRFPYPTRTGDTLTVFNLLKYFSQRHTIDLVSCSDQPLPAEHRAAVTPYCRNLRTVRISSLRSFFNGARSVLGRKPLQAAWFHSPKVALAIDELVSECDYDVLYAHTVRAARYLIDKRTPTPALRVLAMQISMQLNYQRLARYERNPLYRLAFKHEAARLGSFERELIEHFDRTLVISDIDRAAISDQPSDRFFECPHGVTLDDEPASDEAREANSIVFSGNMNYRPNVDAAIFFYREIFPRVRSRFPEAVFTIVGANPDASIRALARDTGVRVTGEVESIYPWLRRSAVGIDPLRAGAGLQNKVLEGMACGLPMVVTPVANEGIRATPETHLLAGEGATAFADQVIRLLEDEQLRGRLGASGRRFIEENWSWDIHFRRLEQMFEVEVNSRSAAEGKERG